jgi:hypothetical protein
MDCEHEIRKESVMGTATTNLDEFREWLDAKINDLTQATVDLGEQLFTSTEEAERAEFWNLRQTFVRRHVLRQVRERLDGVSVEPAAPAPARKPRKKAG